MLTESVERFRSAGLVQTTSPTRMPPGAGMITQNVWYGRGGSLNSRGGYRRWLEVSMSAPISCLAQIAGQAVMVGGTAVNVEGDADCV